MTPSENMQDSAPGNTLPIRISRAAESTHELYLACQRLVPQLTRNNPPPTYDQLEQLLASQASHVFVARHVDFEDEIVGLATLVLYRVPTGVRGYIEDVVVDEQARGRGIGEALLGACLEEADRQGAPQVMLTSNPGRESANRLYLRMGFEQRSTNVYRYNFKKDRVVPAQK